MIEFITSKMQGCLTIEQLDRLKDVLVEYQLTQEEVRSHSNNDYLKAFETSKRFGGCSDNTIRAYLRDAKLYLAWNTQPISDTTKKDIEAFLVDYKTEHNISNVSLNNMRRNLSSFFEYLCDEDVIRYNPVKKLQPIKEPKKLKTPFTSREVNRLRNTADIRNKAIIETLLSTGIRVTELSSLNRSDLSDKSAIITGKGNKQRRIYFNDSAWKAIEEYLATRTDTQDALFISKRNNSRLTKSGIEKLISNIGKQCGVVAHPHKFRRTMATNALNKGMPIQEVQALLGHSNIDTTMIYCKVNEKKLKRDHSKYII